MVVVGPRELVGVVVGVGVSVTVAEQVEGEEADAGGDEQAADDGVLGALHRRAELQPDHHDHRPEDDRHQHVGHAGQAGQARHLAQGIPAGPAEHRERRPVVGQDGVPEPDAGAVPRNTRSTAAPPRPGLRAVRHAHLDGRSTPRCAQGRKSSECCNYARISGPDSD